MNLYSEDRRASDALPLGVLDMATGDNAVLFVLVGNDERSAGLGLDAVELILEAAK